ncbi:hypothetical protein NVSP9465_03987 [Novosphingobium sp. CECT 9465]|nr:hypothetical protein NVSP9465_03987 [Novosphingobium sp. CECT 9465]
MMVMPSAGLMIRSIFLVVQIGLMRLVLMVAGF